MRPGNVQEGTAEIGNLAESKPNKNLSDRQRMVLSDRNRKVYQVSGASARAIVPNCGSTGAGTRETRHTSSRVKSRTSNARKRQSFSSTGGKTPLHPQSLNGR